MKKCKFCAEQIQDEAIKCRFCGSMLPSIPEDPTPISVDEKDPTLTSVDEKVRHMLLTSRRTEAVKLVHDEKLMRWAEAEEYIENLQKKPTFKLSPITWGCLIILGGLILLVILIGGPPETAKQTDSNRPATSSSTSSIPTDKMAEVRRQFGAAWEANSLKTDNPIEVSVSGKSNTKITVKVNLMGEYTGAAAQVYLVGMSTTEGLLVKLKEAGFQTVIFEDEQGHSVSKEL